MSQKTFFTMDSKLTFGTKYKWKTVREVVESDPQWLSWAIKNVEWAQFDLEVLRAIGEPCDDVPAVPPAGKTKATISKFNLDLLQEMIDTIAVLSAGVVEHPSLGSMIVVPLENTASLEHLKRHLVEMQTTLQAGQPYVVAPLPVEPKATPKAPPQKESVPSSTNFAAGELPGDDLPF